MVSIVTMAAKNLDQQYNAKMNLHSKRKAEHLVNAEMRASKTKSNALKGTSNHSNGNHVYDMSMNGCRGDDAYELNGYNGNPIESLESEGQGYQFLERMYKRLVEKARENVKPESKVSRFTEPEKLSKLLDIQIGWEGTDDDKLFDEVQKALQYSVNTNHPHFFNQLFAGADEYAVAGSALTDLMNSSAYTYEMAPVFSLQERYVFNKMMSYIGWSDGEAIFCPGGSMSNMYGVNCARYRHFPDIKRTGMHGLPQLVVYTSQHCHYSLKKGVAFLGIGTDNLVSVQCDKQGRMIPEELEKAIQATLAENKYPLLVNATCGTTVLGAFDPLEPLADLCQKYGLWLHVDGAWGGSALLSKTHRGLLTGAHRADSMTWNAHKMLGIPQQCSVFLTKHKSLLRHTFSANASYLFQQDKFYDVSYDTGDASLQCGRKVDIFKLWLYWKKYGDSGLEARVDKAFHNARYLAEKIRTTEGFKLVFEPQCTNVGFWYIPPSLRGKEDEPDFWERIDKVAPKIKERMMREGTTMINYQPCGEWVNFFRMVVMNSTVEERDMDFVVAEVERLGKDL